MASYDGKAAEYWNARYDTKEFIFGTAPNEYLEQQASQYLKAGSKVLSIADGEGRNSVWLALRGMTVVGFDVSDKAIAKAKQFAKLCEVDDKVSLTLCDTEAFDWRENEYDAIVGIFIQFADPKLLSKIFQQVESALKPGGIFILQGFTPKQLEYKTGGPPLMENLYTEEIIRDAFAKGFKVLDLCTYEKVLKEGTDHSGMSALLGFTAQKC